MTKHTDATLSLPELFEKYPIESDIDVFVTVVLNKLQIDTGLRFFRGIVLRSIEFNSWATADEIADKVANRIKNQGIKRP